MTIAEKGVAGVCIVRNSIDLMPFICGHYLRIGFSHIAFVDDGSSDGTFQFLTRLAGCTQRVSVRRIVEDRIRQAFHMTNTTNELIVAGYPIVIPFDADEFWDIRARELEKELAGWKETAFEGKWVNFVQSRTERHSDPRSLFSMTYRAPGLTDANKASITGSERPFVCLGVRKVGLKATRSVEITKGQHGLVGGPERHFWHTFEIFHVPIRSRDEIAKRGLNYEPRWALTRTDPDDSWQSAHYRNIILSGGLDVEWAANSFDRNGCLDVYGRPMQLMRDARLQYILASAVTYFVACYGIAVETGRVE